MALLCSTLFVSTATFQVVSFIVHQVSRVLHHSTLYALNGTDVCQDYFSADGALVLSKHNYTITDMSINRNDMQRLQEIFSDANGSDNPKKHCNGENDGKSHLKPIVPLDLHDFPSDEEIAKAWNRGSEEYQQKMRE